MPTILITGVSTGIGKACAEKFAREGWRVIGTVRDPERAAAIAWPGDVSLEALDLATPGDGTALGHRVLERYGCPDVVLNNAGMVQFGPLEEIAPGALENLYQVNVFSQLQIVQALLPAMRERRSGTIANVTSLGGRLVFPFFAGYNSTKWALEGISEGLWHELKPFGIRVKAIEPGFVATAIWGKVLPAPGEPLDAPAAYAPYMEAMRDFEATIAKRTPPVESAEEIWAAINDLSDRLRYPVAAYAKPLVSARRWAGEMRFMRFFHPKWMGRDA